VFDLLKKKISGFVDKLKGTGEAAPPEKPIAEKKPPESKPEEQITEEKPKEQLIGEKPPEKKKEAPPREPGEEPEPPEPLPEPEPEEPGEHEPEEIQKKEPEIERPKEPEPKEVLPSQEPKKTEPEIKEEPKHLPPKKEPHVPEKKEIPLPREGPSPPEEKKDLEKKVKKGIFSAVRETLTGTSEIKEAEVTELLEELELGMLESDVALPVADRIKSELAKRVIGAKVKRGQTASFIREQLREVLISLVSKEGFSLPERIAASEKPATIMVLGPNGAGKTTTIAKIVNMLKASNISCVVAASDTFRAAAVEQLQHHGDKLGFKVLSAKYGSDPTALAFDAVNYAKAHSIDVVLIDTAGRQETNVNLLNQLKKMNRVIQPDMKIYVGESIAGNAITEQISSFAEEIGLDGVILTKLDCDAKGGTVISVSEVTGLPIIYVGTGQGYDDIERFQPEKVIDEILA